MQEAQYDEVYGVRYEEAEHSMQVLKQELKLRVNKGFMSLDECEKWAHANLLDKVVFSHSTHKFFNVSHKGELLTPDSFADYYKSILFYRYVQNNGVEKRMIWFPEGFDYYDKAYIPGEIGDGVHEPLYYRDYTVPSGYYNPIRDAFNIAKPFPVFAKETGRDTSHIYTLIEHIAGECAMWLLAWLRAKMIHPTVKTQVVPIIISRAQGSGKSTFGEVICKGLFGADNVLVTDQYDSQSRFNSDYADALIVCQEEKEETDRRNPAAAIKSRATATTIRKEQKGIDPIYQESYTDFLMTSNKDVPIKFDGREDQRRFMIMQADETFTRKQSDVADEVFTKLYGFDADGNRVGTPFTEDKDLIAQFKHELFTRADIAAVKLRQFPKTAAYNRCFTLPRTTEATEIESILRALAPFLKESLLALKIVTAVDGCGVLSDVTQFVDAVQFMPAFNNNPKYIALCRPLIFYDITTNKPYQHSVVERGIYDCGPWLLADYGLAIIPDMDPVIGGFSKLTGRYRTSPAAKICLAEDLHNTPTKIMNIGMNSISTVSTQSRIGERLRVNDKFRPDANGCFETVNEMKPGTVDLTDKSKNVQYMDTLLFESDSCTSTQYKVEEERAQAWQLSHAEDTPMLTTTLYRERLSLQKSEAMRLFSEGIACRIVYSGAKSYHILVRVADAPTTTDEYKWLHAYLCTTLSNKITFDEAVADPARLTRSPLHLPRVTTAHGVLVEGEQGLIAEDWTHVYGLRWRDMYEQWLNRPLDKWESKSGKRLIPTKPEYKDAMAALLDGTFWTDNMWDGRRQVTFFPAYRLCRLLGYTHEELWSDDGILKNISMYAKQNEIGYWRSREHSPIISEIDANIDIILEEQANGND